MKFDGNGRLLHVGPEDVGHEVFGYQLGPTSTSALAQILILIADGLANGPNEVYLSLSKPGKHTDIEYKMFPATEIIAELERQHKAVNRDKITP